MKRLGRKGHPTYRVVVQDTRQSPSSGKYVALLGSYDPHTKQSTLVKDKAEFYLKHGAQPSDRVISLFQSEKVSLPKWVKKPTKKSKELRNPDKLRRNRPADATPPEAPAEETSKTEDVAEPVATEAKSSEQAKEKTVVEADTKAEAEESGQPAEASSEPAEKPEETTAAEKTAADEESKAEEPKPEETSDENPSADKA